MNEVLAAFALGQQQAPNNPGGQQLLSTLFVLGSFFLIFYFLILRPQQRRQRETQKMITNLKRGDRVLTSGGLYGTVWDVKEDLFVLKLTEEVKVEVAKSAVQAVVPAK